MTIHMQNLQKGNQFSRSIREAMSAPPVITVFPVVSDLGPGLKDGTATRAVLAYLQVLLDSEEREEKKKNEKTVME